MTDPEVIGDRQRYAEVGREYRRLEPAGRARREWRRAADDAAGRAGAARRGRRRRPRCARCSPPRAARIEELEEELRLAMVERDPNDDKDVIVEIQGGAGGEEAGLWAGDVYRMLTKYAERRGFKVRAARGRRRQVHLRDQGRRRLLGLQVRGRHAPRAARAGDRVAGAHPHLDGDRGRAARGRGGRRPHRPERPADRRLPLVGARRPVGQHDRLGRAHHAQADAASWSRCRTRRASCRTARRRCACCARASTSRRCAEQQAELAADRRSQVGTGDRAEKIRTYNYGERRVTDHRIKLTVHNLDAVLEGELDEFTAGARRPTRSAAGSRRRPPRTDAVPGTPVREALDSAVIALTAAGRRHAAPRRRGAARPRAGRRPRCAAGRPRRAGRRARRCAPSRTPCAGARSAASRSPTSPASRAFATSTCTSTRACSSRARRPRRSSRRRSTSRRARAWSTSAPAAAPSRWRSRTSARTCASRRPTSARTRSTSRAPTRRAWASTSPSCAPTCSTGVGEVDAVVSNPPYVEDGARAGARDRAPRAGRRALRRRSTAWRWCAGWWRRPREHGVAFLALEVGDGPGDRGRAAGARRGLRAHRAPRRPRRHRPGGGRVALSAADAPDLRALHRGRRRRRVPGRHGLRPGLRARLQGGRRSASTCSSAAARTSPPR